MSIVVTDVNDNDPVFNRTINTNFTVREEEANLFVGQVVVSEMFYKTEPFIYSNETSAHYLCVHLLAQRQHATLIFIVTLICLVEGTDWSL